MQRYLAKFISDDLEDKMVFLGGPRQVGKTTLAASLLRNNKNAYLSWDSNQDRKRILNEELPIVEKLVVLDEIHKYRGWRNLVKGLYDKHKERISFLITGSARLDYYRRGGDSLQGRYHYYRLHPLSLGELLKEQKTASVEQLLKFGGFPEPYFKANLRHWRRWQNERSTRVITEDLLSLERVNEFSQISLLTEILPEKVGSPLSIQSLSEALLVAHKTVARWVTILSNLYYVFLIPPFGSKKIRAVKKEQKLYLWDWSLCEDPGARFENLLACQLLKYCHFIEDTEGYKMELRYLRDTDKREVDFVVIKNKKPLFAVEAKLADTTLSPHIKYFKERTEIPTFYQVHLGQEQYEKDRIKVMNFENFVKYLELP
jgi:uncharacterized protein